jgi:cytidine diphosphoramidate kinase
MSVVWLHGPVGAGKSTLAHALRALVNPISAVAILDEDEVQDAMVDASLFAVGDATAGAIDTDPTSASSIGRLSAMSRVLAQQGLVVIVAASDSPTSALLWNRANLPGYHEVFLRASPETIKHRSRRRRPMDQGSSAPALPRPAALKTNSAPPPVPDLTIDMDNPEPPELIAFRVAVLIPEFVVAAAGAANPANPAMSRFRRGA